MAGRTMATRYKLHTDGPRPALEGAALEAKMKQFVIAGTLAGALAVGGTALAQQPPAPAPTPKTAPAPAPKADTKAAPKTAAKTDDQPAKPAPKPRVKRAPPKGAHA